MESFLHGFVVCFGLIVSIGAQNAFLLKQGILKQHVFWVALLCFLCDVALMSIGVLGLGSLISQSPTASLFLALFGAIFLFTYGSRSFITAYQGSSQLLAQQGQAKSSLKKVIAITLAITLLNPHVYIDTVVIVGGIGGTLSFTEKIHFLLGALICSFLWFFGVGYGAGLLSPYFEKRRTWQILDFVTGLIMYGIAFSLIVYTVKLIE
ncbi:LysE/ArgO family amino acid transporter [Glaesserella parasuis]|uniref:Lysine exporter protein (LYSE/YGGA) n=2 Tax=Glaesserella parasuis TaxID=738 RepID=B8F4P8_GLAP5|nr:LysE/ArgO family amino acid transporter [Glaesserella parasuis]EQA06260.1 lysE type translocator family protein [Glaesserella parasuis 12939]EQA12616.1 lysE type translocator family protein [Glaesserella parasuis H465]EQA13746.1 lysE type translocator family protein [Glaesserella parasuis SW140]ACL32300.1 lysine exporter protein (LYSE/YGGA) [Glaesserella parasuis SH0165]ATW45260.1 amino acid transporter [Glaesserella parasuis str. Nagasaki]